MNTVSIAAPLNNKKVVRAWYMFDWANSVYSLVIISAVFPMYYEGVTTVNGDKMLNFLGFTLKNTTLYSYALSFSFLVVAAILPLLSGIADYAGNKKSFMKFFVWLGSISCMGFFFFTGIDTLYWGIFCVILASIGYSSSLVFYDAYLPEIVTEDRYDKTSARGYSMGYYGSVILLVICLVIILGHDSFGLESQGLASRITFIIVGLWWIGFSIIPFMVLPDGDYQRPKSDTWTKGYQEIRKVWQSLSDLPELKKYLWAYFFFNMGVQTVMYLATLFGTDVLHLGSGELIPTVLVIQLVGAAGAIFFARVSKRRGNHYALMVMIFIWIAICIGAYFITNAYEFYALATVVGLVMGGIQSLSRATYSKLIPQNTIDTTSYFSFFDVTFNLSIVLGTFSYAFIDQITKSMRYSALALAVYFIIGMVILTTVRAKSIRKG
jgi:MFS transporter, UMF1 family